MKRIIHICLTASLLAMVLLLGLASFAYARPEFYLGVSQVYNSINTDAKDFYFSNGYETEFDSIPALDPGNGLSLTLGMEFHGCALELGLTASSHDGVDSLGGPMDARYGIFDMNFKKFIGPSQHFKPYILVGLCLTSLEVEYGSVNNYYGSGDATFSGVGLNLGYGLELKFSNVAFKGEVIYRTTEFTDISGVDASGTLPSYVDGNGLCFNVGMNLYF